MAPPLRDGAHGKPSVLRPIIRRKLHLGRAGPRAIRPSRFGSGAGCLTTFPGMRHCTSRLLAALSAIAILSKSATAQASTSGDTAAKNPDVVKHAQLARRGGG